MINYNYDIPKTPRFFKHLVQSTKIPWIFPGSIHPFSRCKTPWISALASLRQLRAATRHVSRPADAAGQDATTSGRYPPPYAHGRGQANWISGKHQFFFWGYVCIGLYGLVCSSMVYSFFFLKMFCNVFFL